MQYRPDIDGLRAIAVLIVLFFHFQVAGFSGGYIGVDVFFVISGFLIYSIIQNDLDANRFSIRNFYIRRTRRIIPALYTVLSASLFAGLFIFLPQDLIGMAKSLIYTIIFGSNFLFMQETGYFAAPAMVKPLLHTWSLAVEEQFYLFFPIFLVLMHKHIRKTPLFSISIALALATIAGMIWADKNILSAFYMAPARAWEFLMGR